jgi:hypothetical protein
MRYVLRMRFLNPSNKKAEYEAVLHGMRMAKACGATRIKIHGDSNLIAQQVMKECDATCANMIAYRAMYDKLEGEFEGCEVTHIGRESNEEADNLANIGSRCLPIPPGAFFEEIFERSIKIKPVTDPALATCPGTRPANTAPAAGTEDLPKDTTAVMLIEATWSAPIDEVYPWQCPCRRAFDLGSVLGTWRTRRRSDKSKGTQEFTQVQPPRKVKGLRPACLTLY